MFIDDDDDDVDVDAEIRQAQAKPLSLLLTYTLIPVTKLPIKLTSGSRFRAIQTYT